MHHPWMIPCIDRDDSLHVEQRERVKIGGKDVQMIPRRDPRLSRNV
jgi:hypothetical protein